MSTDVGILGSELSSLSLLMMPELNVQDNGVDLNSYENEQDESFDENFCLFFEEEVEPLLD